MEPLEGIGEADRHLGRRVPLPAFALPLVRWVEVHECGPGAVEVEWNLDDTRAGAPGRLELYVATTPPDPRAIDGAGEPETLRAGDLEVAHRSAPLTEAQPSLRPVHELAWSRDGLHLRLTAQGPWELGALLEIAARTC